MRRFDELLNTKPLEKTPLPQVSTLSAPAQEEKKQANLLANQQTSKETKKYASKETNQQTALLTSKLATKPANQQTTKEKRKYGTYLRDDSILAIQLLAVQTQRKDHEVVQEAVDRYFENLRN